MAVITRTGIVIAIGGNPALKKFVVMFPPHGIHKSFTTVLSMSGIVATDTVLVTFDNTTDIVTDVVKV
jgi:hypothetical protein